MARSTTAFLVFGSIALLSGCQRVTPAAPGSQSRSTDDAKAFIQFEPFAADANELSEDGSSHRFQTLGAARTGIEFAHIWTPPERYRVNVDRSFAGGGVAIGDYDGDGLPDVYFSRPFGGGRLYRNLGDFHFEDLTDRAGLSSDMAWGAGCSFADIDNDDDLDLYVCGFDCPNRLFINQGNGTFLEQAAAFGLDYDGSSVMMAFADYDNDGDLDGYLVTNRPYVSAEGTVRMAEVRQKARRLGDELVMAEEFKEFIDFAHRPDGKTFLMTTGQYDHLFRNNGDGTFSDVSQQSGIDGNDMGLSATWWDYDQDGNPDLYVANDFLGPDHLYHNNGDGTFRDMIQSTVPHTTWFSMGTDVGDINNDGRLDFLSADMSGTTHYKQKMGMGDMDRQAWFLDSANPRQYMRNAVYLNTGTDRFMEVAHMTGLANSDWTWAVRFEDFDNDGWVDLFVSNGMTGDYLNSDLIEASRQNGTKLEQPRKRDANMVFKNLGDLQFKNVAGDWGLDYEGVSFGTAVGDLDCDGDLDLVVNNFAEPASVYVNRGGGEAEHRVKIRLRGTVSNRFGIGALVRIKSPAGLQTRYLTLSRGFASTSEPLVHFGLGEHHHIDRLTVQWPSGQVQEFENLSADRSYTITEPHQEVIDRPANGAAKPAWFRESEKLSSVRHVERFYDDFADQPLLPNKLSQLGPGLAWGDVDGDGQDDLFVGGAAGQPGRMLRSASGRSDFAGQRNTSSIEEEPFRGDAECEDMGALLFDADGDNDNDLYVVSGGVECDADDGLLRDRLYLNDGAGNFSPAADSTLPDLRDSGSTVVAADFDRDGDLDLFVGGRLVPGEYPLTPNSRLLQNDGARFTDVTDELAVGLRVSGLVTSALWSDADDDGWLDLLVTHEWGPVKFYHNDQGRLHDQTMAAGLSQRTGWWNGISGCDIDHDGDIDYAVTNFGLNTKYHPDPDNPAVVYYGDFAGDGKSTIIEAKVTSGGVLPVRGKSCSQNAMPFIQTKFPKYHDFAIAELADIYTQDCLNEAHKVEANCLVSGLLINDGNGRFQFQSLPRLAQASPGFGSAFADVNGDGDSDLYVVQNFYSPQRETGRMAGGVSLLLMGSGDGSFVPVWPDRSGLLVPGDAKSLTTSDLNHDGWVDFVVGTNNGTLQAFENQQNSNGRMLQIVLRGEPGNSTAIGARIRAHFEGAPTQTVEVYAGGSYLSQSSTAQFLGLGNSKLREIEVRWPDGATSTFEPDLTDYRMVIQR